MILDNKTADFYSDFYFPDCLTFYFIKFYFHLKHIRMKFMFCFPGKFIQDKTMTFFVKKRKQNIIKTTSN